MQSRFKGCLVPFSPLVISGIAKTELVQITAAEATNAAYFIQGQNLFNCIYLNELLIKLLHRYDPYPNLFDYYQKALERLQNQNEEPQKILRFFEKQLLAELGYGLNLTQEVTGKAVLPNQFYRYHIEEGIVACGNIHPENTTFRGSDLIAIEKNNFETSEILKAARRLMRLVLGGLLGNKHLKSRELFS